MSPRVAKILRLLASLLSVVVLLAAIAAGWFYFKLRASRPRLDGPAPLAGLSAAVTLERDALGVPTIRGKTRADVARALGWVHAQERFFQMDLLRRRAAGELAEIIGASAVGLDRATRLHGFRALARRAVAQAPAEDQALLDAYAAGVNAGLAALAGKPFEYLALRTEPQPWRAEDVVLIVYAMTLDLQGGVAVRERDLATLRENLGAEAFAFFAPVTGPRDAAIDGSTAPLPPVPSAKAINLRREGANMTAITGKFFETEAPGSNSFALAGAHTASGVAMMANDMHLGHGVPNIWYRAVLVWPEGAGERRVAGVTLPGSPLVIAGSNGQVAWGFTNSYIDLSDLVQVPTGISPELYRVPGKEEQQRVETRHETILVKGAPAVEVDYRWTVWGPVIATEEKKRLLVQRWVAHDVEAANLGLRGMETATDVGQGIEVAHRAGIPAQNILLADARGEIAWTIAGRLPKRVGFDGRLPISWTYGDRRWEGLLPAAEVPVVRAPASGRLWTANTRVVGGAALAVLGDGGYAEPMRAAQIRDDLAPIERAQPKDLLAVQLDDRGQALARWRELVLKALTPAVVAGKPARAEFRRLVEGGGELRASVDSVAYRLVRTWRIAVAKRVFDPIFVPCVEADPAFSWSRLPYEEPLWTLVQAKPTHLLSPREASWEALLAGAVDDVVAGLDKEGTPLASATWGRRNTARIVHPLARVLPAWLTGWLNMPADELPGDSNLPRVQAPSSGASERFVVSPGREAEGIFHMPAGQSGHPLSPFYRAGHAAWVRGEPTPFLPGKTEHTVTLQP